MPGNQRSGPRGSSPGEVHGENYCTDGSCSGLNNLGDIVGGNRLYDSLTDATYDLAAPISAKLRRGTLC